MARKDRQRVAQTGKVHRDGQRVDAPPEPGKCDLSHCTNPQHPVLAKAGLPFCSAHGDWVLTYVELYDKLPGIIRALKGGPIRPSGLVIARNVAEEREALKDIGKQMQRRPR